MTVARKDADAPDLPPTGPGRARTPGIFALAGRHPTLRRLGFRTAAGIAVTILLLLSASLGIFFARGLQQGFRQIQQTHQASAALQRLRSAAAELARDHRAFLLTGRAGFLDRYNDTAETVSAQLDRLRRLTASVPEERRAVDAITDDLSRDAAAINASSHQQSAGRSAAVVSLLLDTDDLYHHVQDELDAVQQREHGLQTERVATAARLTDNTLLVAVLRTGVMLAFVGLIFHLLRRNAAIQRTAATERAQAQAAARTALDRQSRELHATEAMLHRRESLLHGLLDAVPQIVFVAHQDGSGEFINRRWHEYTGAAASFTPAQEWHRLVHPQDAMRLQERWLHAVRLAAPLIAEFRLRSKDGHYLWFLAQAVPLAETGATEAERWVGTFTDIDHLHRADAVLRESEERFRRIFEGSPLGMTLSEAGGQRRILQANPAFCRMLGYTPGEVIGRSLNDLTWRGEAEPAPGTATPDDAPAGWIEQERRYVSKQGSVVWARVRSGTFESPAGSDPQWLAVVEDVTRQRETDEALRQAQRMEAVGQLSGGLAHDFNNLLGVVIGNIECLLDTMSDDPERTALAREVLDSAISGAELTRRLLAFGRRQALAPQVINLNMQAARHVSLLSRTLGRTIRIETMFAPNLWSTRADPSQIGDALLNLAINARDAMPHGGVLTIETYNDHVDDDETARGTDVAAGDYAVMAVSDTGIGMTPETRARAVEPFFTTKPTGAGSGLGLSMVYGFVRQSGGHLTIASEPGIGTTVRICLPRSMGDAAADTDMPTARSLPTGDETILVVDDSPEMRQVAERHLRSLGYIVRSAPNGPAALTQLQSGAPVDLLFTDIAMPEGLTGFELADAARLIRPGLKVLFTSGYAGASDSAARSDWQAHLLSKPYRRQDLAEKVRAALSG